MISRSAGVTSRSGYKYYTNHPGYWDIDLDEASLRRTGVEGEVDLPAPESDNDAETELTCHHYQFLTDSPMVMTIIEFFAFVVSEAVRQ